MFGKHFESMYRGSMVGAGAMVFAVWGYVIANGRPDREFGTLVELNPKLIGPILGEQPMDVVSAIDYLCSPDLESASKEQEGRRLVRITQFLYQVVNGAKYRSMRDEIDRREQLKLAQQRYRAKKKREWPTSTPIPGESSYVNGVENGTIDPSTGFPVKEPVD